MVRALFIGQILLQSEAPECGACVAVVWCGEDGEWHYGSFAHAAGRGLKKSMLLNELFIYVPGVAIAAEAQCFCCDDDVACAGLSKSLRVLSCETISVAASMLQTS